VIVIFVIGALMVVCVSAIIVGSFILAVIHTIVRIREEQKDGRAEN
jgi:hypothetical protein